MPYINLKGEGILNKQFLSAAEEKYVNELGISLKESSQYKPHVSVLY